ncbi:hypothetical protein AB0L00_18775 [Actinoallomurus sp. NPDC052308]|uniref:hypothetical protein n=1 Tax=Actinoallomurus sp. NPDC052308 TaxID=3155530 RepID=UPI00343D647B
MADETDQVAQRHLINGTSVGEADAGSERPALIVQFGEDSRFLDTHLAFLSVSPDAEMLSDVGHLGYSNELAILLPIYED